MTREELEARWRALRDSFQRAGALVEGATVVDLFLSDLASVEQTEADTTITLRDAAQRCGYSIEHLARLVRKGTLANAGRKGAPRVRLRDLPVRKMACLPERSYDVDTDARTLRNGRQ